ncbi:MAG: NAD(P)/FAD-dependent oxidoreductase [Gemmatimonadaceae bacterium]
MPNIGIVGGGMLGLTLALRLRQRGFAVTVFEGGATPGGLAAPATIGPYSWDRFYHVMLLSDRNLRDLLTELGIRDRLRWGITRTGFHVDGKLHSLSSSWDFLRFPPLSLIDKARLALTILRAAHVRDPIPLEQLSAGEWLRRWSGTHTYENIWLPLLKAKLGENHNKASAAFIWAIVARMYAARRTGHKREMFGYVEGGYRVILDALCEQLSDIGVRLEGNAPVARVIDDSCAATVLLRDGRVASFDHVVVTTPAPAIARLCPQLSDAERARLERVTYQGIICVSVLLRRTLSGYYVTNITTPGVPFTAVVEMTALVRPETFGGHTLVYLPRYVAQDDSYWSLSDRTIKKRFLDALGVMYPQLSISDVVACEIARVRHVLAVSTQNYSRDVAPPLDTTRPRIHVVNSAQISYGTLNVNETVGLANAQAERLATRLAANAVRVHTPWPAVPATSAGTRA